MTEISPRERSTMAIAKLSQLATELGSQHHALERETTHVTAMHPPPKLNAAGRCIATKEQ
jgi:hypothetical protein